MSRPIIDQDYEHRMTNDWTQDFYKKSDFFNFGYWRKDTECAREASENLMEMLLGFIPEKRGAILDVACGLGATTRHLLKYYRPEQVTGINISPKQLRRSRQNAPGCSFLLMDAARLALGPATMDSVICVEAAFHFATREMFLREVYRVLKPGGHLVLSDILTTWWAANLNRRTPKSNWVSSVAEYENLYREIGFTDVKVVDAKHECWDACDDHMRRWHRSKIRTGEVSRSYYFQFVLKQSIASAGIRNYLLVAATKP